MEHRLHIAGVVVLYNSSRAVLDNIKTYLDQVEFLYAVDNSIECDNSIVEALQRWEKVKYVRLGKNFGIAHALNVGMQKAIEGGYGYMLTMDDDSQASPNMVDAYLEFLEKCDDSERIGIVSPFHFYRNYTLSAVKGDKEVLTAITSGSLINLRSYQRVGPFLEQLFIDYVDFEFCLRLNANGYKVVQAGDAVLYHNLGDLVPHKILWMRIGATNHSPLRIYYRTRNRLFVAEKYLLKFPGFVLKDLVTFLNELVKILLFESERFEKFKMVFKGLADFILNRFGEYRKT